MFLIDAKGNLVCKFLWNACDNSSLLCFLKANDESREQNKEYEETKKQIEEDSDREILDIKNNYEIQLRREREENIKLKGETGIMKKKVRDQILCAICRIFSYVRFDLKFVPNLW